MAFYPHIQAPRPEVRAFLDDVREHPEDDTPRLVLADWLQDQDGEADRARGEFLRLQCLLSQPGVAQRGWAARHRQLLAEYAADWVGPLAHLVDGWRFDRGMLHLAVQGYRCYARELHQVVRTETFAWVEGLTLRQVTGGFINVAEQLPLMRHLRALTIEESRPGELALCRLFTLRELGGLRELNLAGCQVSPEAVAFLATRGVLANLEALDLTRNFGCHSGVIGLARGDALPALRRLRLGYNQIQDDALAALAVSPLLRRLEELDLRGNASCDGPGLAALLVSDHARNLRSLDLTMIRLTTGMVRTLVASPALGNLRTLHLSRTQGGSEFLKQLAFAESLPRLRHLSLARNQLSDDAVLALASGTTPARPTVLDVPHNQLTREAAVAIATSPVFAQLEELDLEGNRIGDEGAVALANSPTLTRLRFLDVGNNGLSAGGKAPLLQRFGRRVVLV